jgi:hypothetical protein
MFSHRGRQIVALSFTWINRTGLTQKEVLRRAKALQKAGQREGISFTLQEAVDSVIDAASEYLQG